MLQGELASPVRPSSSCMTTGRITVFVQGSWRFSDGGDSQYFRLSMCYPSRIRGIGTRLSGHFQAMLENSARNIFTYSSKSFPVTTEDSGEASGEAPATAAYSATSSAESIKQDRVAWACGPTNFVTNFVTTVPKIAHFCLLQHPGNR